jgi:hypothetical protein
MAITAFQLVSLVDSHLYSDIMGQKHGHHLWQTLAIYQQWIRYDSGKHRGQNEKKETGRGEVRI